MTDSNKIDQLEQTVKELKVRVFDASEQAQQAVEQARQFQQALIYISEHAGIELTEETKLDEIVRTVCSKFEHEEPEEPE